MVTRLDTAYRAQTRQIRERVERFAIQSWNGLGSWRDQDYERFVNRVVPRIESAQQQISNLTDSYIRQYAVNEFGTVRAGVAAVATTEALRGVPAVEVYRRPFVDAYTALAGGQSMTAALAAGRERLSDLVGTGMQLSRTHSAREALGRTRFLGFQRVPRGAQSCALCLIASTQRYHVGDLLPIHPGCMCLCKPLHGAIDQQVINPELLDRVHDEVAAHLGQSELAARNLGLGKEDAQGRPLSDYTDLLITRHHGEIGNVLTWRSHSFTSEQHIAALAN